MHPIPVSPKFILAMEAIPGAATASCRAEVPRACILFRMCRSDVSRRITATAEVTMAVTASERRVLRDARLSGHGVRSTADC